MKINKILQLTVAILILEMAKNNVFAQYNIIFGQ